LSRKRYRGRQQEQPRSGLDVTTLLAVRTKKNYISPENAIPEFKQILANAEEISTIKDAILQFGKIVEDWIKHSLGESGYDRALEGIRIMREECVEMEEPDEFNTFSMSLKKKLLKEELGGNRRELWWKIRMQKLGLIDKNISPVSSVDEEEAKAVGRILQLTSRSPADPYCSFSQLVIRDTCFARIPLCSYMLMHDIGNITAAAVFLHLKLKLTLSDPYLLPLEHVIGSHIGLLRT